MTLTLERDLCR